MRLEYTKSPVNLLAVGVLKLYGVLSRPFGYRWLAWVGVFTGRFVDRRATCTARIEVDTRFRFFLGDYYWNKLVCRGFRYEPEIEAALSRLPRRGYCFLDLGANYGYWSCLASSARFGGNRVIAVEPVRGNFRMLEQNRALNGGRFAVEQAAISDVDGQQAVIHTHGDSHANEGATLLADSRYAGPDTEVVRTLSIDGLLEKYEVGAGPLVIKLDLEGMEVAALRGATRALAGDTLLIYEDHGSDAQCHVSAFVLGLGLAVFHFESGRAQRVSALDGVKAIKTRPNKGYNLFACHTDSDLVSLLTAD